MKFNESIVFLHERSENGYERTFLFLSMVFWGVTNSWIKLKKPKDCLIFNIVDRLNPIFSF